MITNRSLRTHTLPCDADTIFELTESHTAVLVKGIEGLVNHDRTGREYSGRSRATEDGETLAMTVSAVGPGDNKGPPAVFISPAIVSVANASCNEHILIGKCIQFTFYEIDFPLTTTVNMIINYGELR